MKRRLAIILAAVASLSQTSCVTTGEAGGTSGASKILDNLAVSYTHKVGGQDVSAFLTGGAWGFVVKKAATGKQPVKVAGQK